MPVALKNFQWVKVTEKCAKYLATKSIASIGPSRYGNSGWEVHVADTLAHAVRAHKHKGESLSDTFMRVVK